MGSRAMQEKKFPIGGSQAISEKGFPLRSRGAAGRTWRSQAKLLPRGELS
jgi:hypothetical protein